MLGYTHSQVLDVFYLDIPRLLVLKLRIHPANPLLILRQKQLPLKKLTLFLPPPPKPPIIQHYLPYHRPLLQFPHKRKPILIISQVHICQFLVHWLFYVQFLSNYPLVNTLQVLFTDRGACTLSILDELRWCHLLLLFGVMGVGGQHYDGVC